MLVTVAGVIRHLTASPSRSPSRTVLIGFVVSVVLLVAARLAGVHPQWGPLPYVVLVLGAVVSFGAALAGNRDAGVLRAPAGAVGPTLLSIGLLWGLMGLPAG